MSEAAVHPGWTTPLASRLSSAPVLAPVGFAAIVACAYLAAWVLYANLFWEMQGLSLSASTFEEGSWRARLHEALVLAYTAAISTWSLRGAVRRLNEVRPALRSSGSEFQQQLLDLITVPRWRWLAAGICGAAGVAAGPPENPTWSLVWSASGALHTQFLWGLGFQSLLGWLMFRAVAIDIHIALSFRRIGEHAANLDLLDLRPLEPFTRVGLRTVFLWIVWFSLLSLSWLGRGPRTGEMWALIPIVVVVSTALLVPALGIRRRIRAAKRAELGSVDVRIRRERDVIQNDSEPGRSSIAELVAYRSLIERVREWPFDASTLLRFGLAMGVLVGSWLGGAVVERILGRVLD